jgi:hypothetical protein
LMTTTTMTMTSFELSHVMFHDVKSRQYSHTYRFENTHVTRRGIIVVGNQTSIRGRHRRPTCGMSPCCL